MIRLRWVITVFFVQASLAAAVSQERLSNLRVVVDSPYVEVSYTLEAEEPGLRFDITPSYLDTAGNKLPMRSVDGDVGKGVTAGRNRTFKWSFLRDLTAFGPEMRIALDKVVMPPTVDVWLPKKKYRCAGKITFPGIEDEIQRYELIDESRKVLATGNLEAGKNGYALKLPRSLPLSSVYRLRLWNRADLPAYTSSFRVHRRIPLIARWGAIGLAAGTTAFLLLKPSPDNELPPPYGL